MKKLLIIAILLTNACAYNPRLDIPGMPKPPQSASQDYSDGWQAGCQTGMATYGNSYYKTLYRTNVDPDRMQHPEYNRGWELGQRYCSYYSQTYLSNKEFFSNDLRQKNTWFELSGDGFFSYTGWDEF